MIPYEMKKRGPIPIKTLESSGKVDICEYKTGFEEFKVIKLEIKEPGLNLTLNLGSMAMAVVTDGSADIETEFGSI